MCGRYTIEHVWREIQERFKVEFKGEWKTRFNASPSQNLPIILQESKGEITMAKWGLIPHWAKEGNVGYKMINARAETLAEKSSYRVPFQKRRCLVIASGFYEWKDKVPYYFYPKDNSVLTFAGLYDRWTGPDGKEIISYTIITTLPNTLLSGFHDRMPVVLPFDSSWMDDSATPEELKSLLIPYSQSLNHHRVSQEVSNPRNDHSGLIVEVEEKEPFSEFVNP